MHSSATQVLPVKEGEEGEGCGGVTLCVGKKTSVLTVPSSAMYAAQRQLTDL